MGTGNVVRTIFYSSALLLRAPGMLIKYKMKRRGAINTFKREMISCGVPVGEAEMLAREYPFNLGDLMSLMRSGSNLRPS